MIYGMWMNTGIKAISFFLFFNLQIINAQFCPGDFNLDKKVTVAEIIRVINSSLHGCEPTFTRTATRTATPRKTFTPGDSVDILDE